MTQTELLLCPVSFSESQRERQNGRQRERDHCLIIIFSVVLSDGVSANVVNDVIRVYVVVSE